MAGSVKNRANKEERDREYHIKMPGKMKKKDGEMRDEKEGWRGTGRWREGVGVEFMEGAG